MEDKIKELKKELSKLSGVDMFNPKFRDVFKRYLSEGKAEGEAEEAKVDDAATDNAAAEAAAAEEPKQSETAKGDELKNAAENDKKTGEEEQETDKEAEDVDKKGEAATKEGKAKTQATAEESAKITATKDEQPPKEKPAPTSAELTEEDKSLARMLGEEAPAQESPAIETKEEAEAESTSLNDKLLEAQVEIELRKAGIREDRLDVAKRLFLPEVKTSGTVEKVKELITEYPEWLNSKGGSAAFGMPIGDQSDGLTAEERRLKTVYGIDPKG